VSKEKKPAFPEGPFRLLFVEGGDEEAVCEWLIGPTDWTSFRCWIPENPNVLPGLARLAHQDANIGGAQSVGLVLDTESDIKRALEIARGVFAAFGASVPAHAGFASTVPKCGLFVSPDGSSHGAIETLCRQAAADTNAARCVDAYESCAGVKSLDLPAQRDKRWVTTYIAATLGPTKRLPEALKANLFDPLAFASLKNFLLAL
jgi:hypothetical protein